MLRLVINGDEYFNEEDQSFSTVNDIVIELEHSLLSLSKWESKHQKPFLSAGAKTEEEIFSYVIEMVLTENLDITVISRFSQRNFDEIREYIDSTQSATTFGVGPKPRGSGEIITSELIYYWLVLFNIPFSCEQWHLNRLFSLIRICNIKNSKPKKMNKHEIAMRNRELNEQRKAALGTKG